MDVHTPACKMLTEALLSTAGLMFTIISEWDIDMLIKIMLSVLGTVFNFIYLAEQARIELNFIENTCS